VAKAKRKQRLKVYSTPIGFHDALVAVPSQKAALEAWGADTNLFSQGSAHVVTDPKLTKVPLQHPGQVVKVLRGTEAEQLAALSKQAPPKRTKAPKAEVVPKKPKKRPRKPSRGALSRAEAALDKVEKRQSEQMRKLEKQQDALEKRMRETKRRHERERDEAQEKIEEARAAYNEAIRRYESG
jgi:vacuolar-type H+-ATPase subunit I/STV1